MKKDTTHNEDFFDYLSELDASSVSDEDVLDIHQRIDKKVQAQAFKGPSNGLSVILVVGFTALLSFVLFNKRAVVQIGKTAAPVTEKKGDILSDAIQLDTTAVTRDTLATSIAPPVIAQKNNSKKEHFEKENMDTHFAEEVRSDKLETRKVSLLDTTKSIAQLPDNYLQLLPNASVIYIYNLKVTEFQKLYFKKMKPFVLTDENWLSAQFETYEDFQFHMSDGKSTNEYTLDMLLKDALKLFNKQKYKTAFSLFNELLEYNAKDANAFFYSGLCQYHSGKYEDAIARFNKVIELENNVFDQEAEWYKALSLLKNNEQQEAVALLLKINTQQGFYANNAGEKLKEINGKK